MKKILQEKQLTLRWYSGLPTGQAGGGAM